MARKNIKVLSDMFCRDCSTAWDKAGEEHGWEVEGVRQRSLSLESVFTPGLVCPSVDPLTEGGPLAGQSHRFPYYSFMALIADLRYIFVQIFGECPAPSLDCKFHERRAHGICLAHQPSLQVQSMSEK